MSGSNDYTYNRFDAFEAKLKAQKEEEVAASEEEEVIEEGAMHRDAKTGKVVDKAEVGKTYYPAQPKQKTSVAKRKEEEGKKADEESMKVFQKLQKNVDQKRKLALKKEELEMFSAEEIELLGLTEAKCDKCEGDCECDDKKEEKKSKKSGGAKPDYIDADGDGDKEESMKKALEDKKGKKN